MNGVTITRVCHSLIIRNRLLISNKTSAAISPIRHLNLSPVCQLKEIHQEEKDGEVIIKGVHIKSPREDYLIKTPISVHQDACTECPICKLGSGINIRHTDVLILSQFVGSDGRQLPRLVTGLCLEQHKRLRYLIVMSRHAGLLPKRLSDGTIDPRDSEGWKANNKYYDDEGVDDLLDSRRKKL